MREFFKTKKDIEERIRNNVRNIAFYADNLTKKDATKRPKRNTAS